MKQPALPEWFRLSAFFLFGIIGAIVGYMFGYSFVIPLSIIDNLPLLLVVTLFGAFGGLLYAMKEKKLELPDFDANNKRIYKLGWISDCLAGIAGAYVVFLIVPGNFKPDEPFEMIKILGLAIVGGYGGQPLMDKVLGDLLKRVEAKVEKVEERVTKNRELIEEDQEKVKQIEVDAKKQAKIVADTLALLECYLDEDLNTKNEAIAISELIKQVSSRDRRLIFVEAKKVREINSRPENRKPFMVQRTIPVFEALVEADEKDSYRHRYYAQIGYALKDLAQIGYALKDLKEGEEPNWSKAVEALTRAINNRGSLNEDKNGSFWVYEFNRAFCRINLDPNFDKGEASPGVKKEIWEDLKAATKSENGNGIKLDEYLDKLDVKLKGKLCKWLAKNKSSTEDIELTKLLCKSSESSD